MYSKKIRINYKDYSRVVDCTYENYDRYKSDKDMLWFTIEHHWSFLNDSYSKVRVHVDKSNTCNGRFNSVELINVRYDPNKNKFSFIGLIKNLLGFNKKPVYKKISSSFDGFKNLIKKSNN